MSLTDKERHDLREAIYVASQGANPTLATALAQLNEMVLDETYPFWTNKAVIDSAIGRSPGYTAAWDALLRELKEAPPVGGPVSPEPEPHEDSYPHVPEDPSEFSAAVLKVLSDNGLILRDGCVGVGGFDPKSAASLQVFGNAFSPDAIVEFHHLNGAVATKSLAADRGFRDQNNQRIIREQKDAYDPDGGVHYKTQLEVVDPSRISSQVGTDSKHQLSVVRNDPKYPHQYTQDAVFVIDEENKTAGWKLYRTGWKMVNAVDAKYGPEKFFRPVFE